MTTGKALWPRFLRAPLPIGALFVFALLLTLAGFHFSRHFGTRVNPKDGATAVLIPAGPFEMGDADQEDNPRHIVVLSAYWIYKNDVTVAQYRRFCKATGRTMPDAPSWGWRGDNPIVNVTWLDAMAYAKWAGVDLPTDAQWEKAARGADGRKYPWGNDFDRSKLWCSKSTFSDAGRTAAVGRYTVSPYGLSDMAGNVMQWTRDRYEWDFWTSDAARRTDPENEASGWMRGLRGSSWYDSDSSAGRCSYRGINCAPNSGLDYAGFRCAARVN
jgi:formylglycine-generating enzyme required for sulfatase activity